MQEGVNPISTFLVDAQTYQDLTERARLNDILKDKIIALEMQNKAILERLNELENRLDAHSKKIYRENHEPGQTSQDRATRLDHYMDARPDHKASYEALKGFLGINDVLLNSAIAALKKEHPGKYGTIKDAADKRKRILAVIPKIS